jgi:hypothetical protein
VPPKTPDQSSYLRDVLPIPKFLGCFSMRGFFAFLGALLDEAKGAGATFRFGALSLLVSEVGKGGGCRENVPFGMEGFGDEVTAAKST